MAISSKSAPVAPPTVPFDKFWTWLQAHRNCILRAGTPEVILFDHEDYHWFLATEDEATQIVQLGRGKDLVGEIVIVSSDIAYVQAIELENEEVSFELVVETDHAREVAYHFVMAHGYDETEMTSARKWTH